eukprot:6467539-Amphidinium_carterae.2
MGEDAQIHLELDASSAISMGTESASVRPDMLPLGTFPLPSTTSGGQNRQVSEGQGNSTSTGCMD